MQQNSPAGALAVCADFLVRHRKLLFAAALVVSAFAFIEGSQLTLEHSIESLYSLDDPHLLDYRESKALFGGDEFVIVAYPDPSLLSSEGLDALRTFADQLSQVPGVQSRSTQYLSEVLSPREIPWIVRPLFQSRRSELISFARGTLIGADDQTAGIVLRLAPEDASTTPRARTIAEIRERAQAHSPPAYVVGEPVLVHDMFQYVEEDGERLFYASLALLGLALFVLFRSVRWVVLSVLLVAATVEWTKAILVLCQMRLSMVSSMLNSLVTIVGIATVTRVLVYYREQRALHDPVSSFRRTFVELSPAILWTTLTAAAGFVSLLSSKITPVRSFGTMMTLGTMLVLISGAMLLPAGILLGRTGTEVPTHAAERRLVTFLGGLTVWVERRGIWILGSVALLFGLSVAGVFQLELDTDFSRNFRASSPIVHALDFVETRLGGAGTWEVNFPAPAELTPEFLQRVRTLAASLRDLNPSGENDAKLTSVISMTDLLDVVPGPMSSPDQIRHKLDLIRVIQPEFESSLYNAQRERMRLVLRARERTPSATKLALINSVNESTRSEFHDAKTTGLYVLLTFLIESLLRDQVVSFALTVVMVLAIMLAAYRSLRIGLVSLIPNALPILLVVGAMGWLRVPVNVGTAMIAAVSMGLTIDASIFYLYGYRRSREAGLTLSEALRQTHQGFGRALVFGTLALVVGFSVLALSRFIPLVYFGVLVSLAMLGGLFGNLLLLPLLLRWVDDDRPGLSLPAQAAANAADGAAEAEKTSHPAPI